MTWLHTGLAQSAEARSRLLFRHLSQALDRPETEIAITRDSFGKPMLSDPGPGYWFNCSSCNGLMLIAGSRNGPVGADIETVERCRPVWEDAARQFAPAERARLAAMAPDDQPLAFARLWTAKEAVLKARGTGIVLGLTEPDLSSVADLAAPPPWKRIKINVGGDRFAVTWYTLPLDAALVIAARADAAPNLETT
ncbi:4'-phosphopantetheinyl transferase [Paramagnetospirillum magnetotacticum MS-1]|uniref:4'-phosphopantetheinyl transferase n=1 Tax=Paramagnetospirillum magnetotacticum MS-1 TaxID=272627 RepID=A0A0C2YXP5_PARME|nr:4'-phosphopantetheinyl transferase superfamily protein [Paramagnetospirillum magnetotacticum]KIL99883.1 4'-phosphopantetheinyl transferase [Paramagnetospirillum magnetotacticum MS-1]